MAFSERKGREGVADMMLSPLPPSSLFSHRPHHHRSISRILSILGYQTDPGTRDLSKDTRLRALITRINFPVEQTNVSSVPIREWQQDGTDRKLTDLTEPHC